MTLDLFGPAMPSGRPLVALSGRTPRPYQSEAVAAVLEAHKRSRGALLVLPTGAGKSFCGASVAAHYVSAGQRVLVLTPTITLCDQMYKDLWGYGLRDIGKEQADNRVRSPFPAVVVASVATMRGDRLQRFQPNTFGLVVGDEAHRAVSESQMAIFDYFWTAKRLGLTATPVRVDGVSLANVFDETAYQMTMLSAIEAGWLVPIKFKTAITDFDAKALRTLGGDVTASSVESEIVRAGLLHEAANTLAELSDGERTVAFLPTVASSKAFVGELVARGVSAEHVDGTTPREIREEVFARFSAGETRVLSNVAVLTEGWDCLDEETEILTAAGWRGMGRVAAGDDVYALNRDTGAMELVKVDEYVERPVNPGERMFTIESQHVNVRTTEGHEFHVKYRDPGKRGALCSGFITSTGTQLAVRRSSYALPISAEIAGLPGVPLSDDELRLVAWFMTDGGFERSQFCISQTKHHEHIRQLLGRIGIEFGERCRTPRGGYPNAKPNYIFRMPKRAWGKYAAYLDKNVAASLHQMTRAQFAVFWEELLLGDGCSSRRLWCDRKEQADAYMQMAVTRGFATCFYNKVTKNNHIMYVVATRDSQWLTSDPSDKRAARMALSEPRDGERVWCVRNRLSTVVTRRRGKVAIIGNCPAASVIALLNPTKSWSRLTQMIGRGTRLAPGKTHALMIDFCPGRLRKGRLASPADALAGRMLDDAVHEHLAKEGDLAKAIQDAERTVEDLEAKKQARAEAARRKAEKAAELAHLATKKQFTYGVQEHDAQDILGGSGKGDRGVSFMDSSEVTEEEKNAWRRKRGLCTEKQAKILAKHGLNPWMTRNLARVAMDAIAANGWKPPEEIKRDPRFYRKADVAPADLAEALLEQLKAG